MTGGKPDPALRRTIIFAYISMAMLGATLTIVNSTMARLAESYGVEEHRISLLISCLGVGRLLIQTAVGMLSDRFGRKTLLTAGYLGMLLFFCFMPFVTTLAGGMLMCVFCGFSYGMVNTTSLALVFDCYAGTGHTDIAQVRVQTVYATGGILIPLSASAALSTGMPWKYLYWFCACAAIGTIIFQRFIRFPPLAARTVSDNGYRRMPQLRKEGTLLILATFCLYGSHTMGLTWITTLAAHSVHMPQAEAVVTLSIFSLGALLGSLCIMRLLKRMTGLQLLTWAPLMAVVFFAICTLTHQPWVFRISTLLAGMCTGSLFNLIVGVAGHMFPQLAGTISGMLSTSSASASLLLPALTGWMLDSVSVTVMFSIVFILLLAGIGVIIALRRRDRLLSMESPQS